MSHILRTSAEHKRLLKISSPYQQGHFDYNMSMVRSFFLWNLPCPASFPCKNVFRSYFSESYRTLSNYYPMFRNQTDLVLKIYFGTVGRWDGGRWSVGRWTVLLENAIFNREILIITTKKGWSFTTFDALPIPHPLNSQIPAFQSIFLC